jgi:hypothetical protein
MYKQFKDIQGNIKTNAIYRLTDNAFIPFAPDNTDYQQFKKDLADGVALNDAEGNAMTADQITEFLQGLA